LGITGLSIAGLLLITFTLAVLGLTFFRRNLVALFGVTVAALGGFLNFICLVLNGGMPCDAIIAPFSVSVPVSIATKLAFLGDRFQIGPAYVSIGDLILFSSVPFLIIGNMLELYRRLKKGETNET
jgi:hypothetical protein